MTRRRTIRDEPPPAREDSVLRGVLTRAGLTAQDLRENAELNFDQYGFYAVSVWVASGPQAVENLARTKLVRFDRYAEFTVHSISEAGLHLWPTGVAPHYDLVYSPTRDLEGLVDSLLAAPYDLRTNTYVDREGD